MSTAHIAAEPGDFAPAVLMPGDPRRAQRIAELLMPDARLVTEVRGMLGFTGTVNGKPLSVMGSGMGMPSATLYATELFKDFGVVHIVHKNFPTKRRKNFRFRTFCLHIRTGRPRNRKIGRASCRERV